MKAAKQLEESIRGLSGVLVGGDPYISADDKHELREVIVKIADVRNLALSREADDIGCKVCAEASKQSRAVG